MKLENAHIISYGWEEFSPLLLLYHNGRLEEIELSSLKFIDISLSKGIWCTGRFEGNEYHRCPDNAPVGTAWRQCPKCSRPVIPILDCIFEPMCDGSLCNVNFCSRRHAVYLAFFRNLIKVGMTSLQRARTRAIEQGADAYAVIKELPNRLAARNFEKHVSERYGIPQAHSSREILSTFSKEINKDDIKIQYTEKIRDMGGELGTLPELRFLEDYPISLPLRRRPLLRATATRHHGNLLGIKGKYLIYESSGIYAVNLSDMVGRKIQGILT